MFALLGLLGAVFAGALAESVLAMDKGSDPEDAPADDDPDTGETPPAVAATCWKTRMTPKARSRMTIPIRWTTRWSAMAAWTMT